MFDSLDKIKYLTEFQRKQLQKSLQEPDLSKLHRQRILIMLLVDEGKTQTEICQQVGCSPATARHWILMAQSGMAHYWKKRSVGRPQTIDDRYRERLKELVSNSPRDFGYPFRRWTGNWLSKHLAKEFGVQISDRYINYLLKEMGLSTRPQPEKAIDGGTGIVIRDLYSQNDFQGGNNWQLDQLFQG